MIAVWQMLHQYHVGFFPDPNDPGSFFLMFASFLLASAVSSLPRLPLVRLLAENSTSLPPELLPLASELNYPLEYLESMSLLGIPSTDYPVNPVLTKRIMGEVPTRALSVAMDNGNNFGASFDAFLPTSENLPSQAGVPELPTVSEGLMNELSPDGRLKEFVRLLSESETFYRSFAREPNKLWHEFRGYSSNDTGIPTDTYDFSFSLRAGRPLVYFNAPVDNVSSLVACWHLGLSCPPASRSRKHLGLVALLSVLIVSSLVNDASPARARVLAFVPLSRWIGDAI